MTTVDQQVSALNNLIAGINLAQSRGTYSLSESAQLHEAVTILVNSVNNQAPPVQHEQKLPEKEKESRSKSPSRKTS
tara:strand:+ start:1473 stop:1703 length:231 start_codon:yes stop_codon:yes gene_type:complete